MWLNILFYPILYVYMFHKKQNPSLKSIKTIKKQTVILF